MYIKLLRNSEIFSIYKPSEGKFIPLDIANKDYQEYLAWVELGNTATEEER